MLKSVEITRRQSEIRQALAGLVGKEKPTEDEVRNIEAMDLEFRSNETRYRAALICEDSRMVTAGFYPARWDNMTKEEKRDCLRFNDQRGTAVTLLSEPGANIPQICAITGHSLQLATRILRKYLAMTEVLSMAAIRLFENAPETAFANRMQTTQNVTTPIGQNVKGNQ